MKQSLSLSKTKGNFKLPLPLLSSVAASPEQLPSIPNHPFAAAAVVMLFAPGAIVEREQNYVTLEFQHTGHAIAHTQWQPASARPGSARRYFGPISILREETRKWPIENGVPATAATAAYDRDTFMEVKLVAAAASARSTRFAPATPHCWRWTSLASSSSSCTARAFLSLHGIGLFASIFSEDVT